MPRPLSPPFRLRLLDGGLHPCTYLENRQARFRFFFADDLPPEIYHAFMDRNFRRSGHSVYQPVCPSCRACMMLRVPVERFAPSRSQRRCVRRNADLTVEIGEPSPTDEKYALYRRYLQARHVGGMVEDDNPDSFVAFLYSSPTNTVEFVYRDPAGRLAAVGICDVSLHSISTVYFYFDPDQPRRGLGTFGVLKEIEVARDRGIPWYYMGYWVKDARTMDYKRHFRPCELLCPDGQWRELTPDAPEPPGDG